MNAPSRLFSLLGFVIFSGFGISQAAERPNVLFIAVDDLRPAIGCYGDAIAVTPNLDRLAKRGVQFNNAYCQVAVCNPSRASLMTGLRPDNLGVWTLPVHFREAKPDAVTIPQWFRKFGYTAVSHGKIFHNPTPDPQSWSEPIRPLPSLPFPYPEGTRELIKEAAAKLPERDWRKKSLRPPSTGAPELPDDKLLDGARTLMAIDDLRRLGQAPEPFFLAMGYIRPHLAWVAPKKYWDLYEPATLPVLTDETITPDTPAYALHNNSELTHYVDLIDLPRPWQEETVAEDKARQLAHAYYACVSYVDAQIGLLLDALDEEGLADNTIIVLWSDHGWKLGEYRGWGKMTNYEIDARVPLFIAAPGLQTAGQQSDQLVELLDLYPTLCDLAGIDKPDFVDGRSLLPVLENVEQAVREGAVNQYYRRWEGREYMGYSIRSQEYRLVEWRDFTTGEVTAHELYDHRSEHSEKENIAESAEPQVVEGLTAELLKTHPRKGFSLVPAVHSNPAPGRLEAKLTIANHSESELFIAPISQLGHRSRSQARKVKPTETLTLDSRIGSVYVIESADGKVHQIHSPAFPEAVVEVKGE
ncbi:sulfatase [Roseibacillus persicicus]|uniref:sulfatase n=1 Tax=Roseibacillus persicicus TaxID=454148 RepID=UPI00280F8754|nr:sulfatase [Roseibacillus persicicus]MDQ8189844.1 sulfatase [Roseibacillus persicicus]